MRRIISIPIIIILITAAMKMRIAIEYVAAMTCIDGHPPSFLSPAGLPP